MTHEFSLINLRMYFGHEIKIMLKLGEWFWRIKLLYDKKIHLPHNNFMQEVKKTLKIRFYLVVREKREREILRRHIRVLALNFLWKNHHFTKTVFGFSKLMLKFLTPTLYYFFSDDIFVMIWKDPLPMIQFLTSTWKNFRTDDLRFGFTVSFL